MLRNFTGVLCFLALATAHAAEPAPTYVSVTYPEVHGHGLVRTERTEEFFAAQGSHDFLSSKQKLPKTVSLRGQAGPVENQGVCGSCWDFSLISTLRGTLSTLAQDPGRLSFNYLLNCASEMGGCKGGDFSAADLLLEPKGAPLFGTDDIYTGTQGPCWAEPVAASALKYHMIGYGNSRASFKDLATVLGILHRPLTVDVIADDAFESYGGGVFNTCAPHVIHDINHMVTLEGYDCESSIDQDGNCVFDASGNLPPGVGTLLIKNSYGSNWGDLGYITIKFSDDQGHRCNEIAHEALYFDVKTGN